MTTLVRRLGRGEIVVPYMLSKIYELKDAWDGAEADARRARILIKFLQDDIKQYEETESLEGYRDLFHPSSANRCLKELWFKRLRAPGDRASTLEDLTRMHRIFGMGDHVHLRWMADCEMLGILVKREVPFYDKKEGIIGKADMIVDIPNEGKILVDVKSANDNNFGKFKRENSAGEHYEMQLQMYLEKLNIDRGCFIVENKNNQTVMEFPVERNPDVYKYAVERKNILNLALETLEPPPAEGKSIKPTPCKWCPYTGVCFIPRKFDNFMKGLDHAITKTSKTKNNKNKTSDKKSVAKGKRLKLRLKNSLH